MHQTRVSKTLPLAFIAGVMLAAAVFFTAMAAFTVARGDWGMSGWGMGSGHMQQMMGGGTNSSNAPVTAGGKTEAVAMRGSVFAPGNLQVPVGATVTWTNFDAVPHTASAKDGSWDTGIFNGGESKSITFDKAGDYEYYCKVHPAMIAYLAVR